MIKTVITIIGVAALILAVVGVIFLVTVVLTVDTINKNVSDQTRKAFKNDFSGKEFEDD